LKHQPFAAPDLGGFRLLRRSKLAETTETWAVGGSSKNWFFRRWMKPLEDGYQ